MGLGSVEAAAAGIVDIVNENMFGALRLVSVQQGFDPRDFALVAFGGAGPLHANALGKLTGAWPVIIPPSPGVLCAYGDATTQRPGRGGPHLHPRVRRADRRRAARPAARAGRGPPRHGRGQGVAARRADHHLPGGPALPRAGLRDPVDVEVAAFDGDGAGLAALAAAFDAEHERLFSFLLEQRARAGQRARHRHRAAPGRRARSGCPTAAPTPRPRWPRTTRSGSTASHADAAVYDRARAAGRERGRRTGHRHRDGLHHPRPARARRHRASRRQPPHPSRRRADCTWRRSSRPRPATVAAVDVDSSPWTSSRTRCATRATRWTRCCSAPRCPPASASSTTSSR